MIRLIEITQDHIREGKPQDPECCPIALAMRDEYKTTDVAVDDCTILINDKEIKIDPDQIGIFTDWINKYDECLYEDGDIEERAPKPFTLRIIE
jgi:hypothetical protein